MDYCFVLVTLFVYFFYQKYKQTGESKIKRPSQQDLKRLESQCLELIDFEAKDFMKSIEIGFRIAQII